MTRIALVTGAYGFIGRHVARRLAQNGWRVSGIGHGNWDGAQSNAWGVSDWRGMDVTLDNLIGYGVQPNLIVHCAGSASVGFSLEQPYLDFQRTVATTAAVLEFARIHVVEAAVVLPSSAAVYGDAQTTPIAESAALQPVSPYGEHKRMAENLCRMYAGEFGVPTAVVRLFSVYGPGLRKQLLWDACNRLAGSEAPRFFGDGTETRDWLHVEDAAALLELAGTHAGRDCPVVNGGRGEPVALHELLAHLFRLLGRSDAPEFRGTRRGDPKHYCANIEAVRGWGWSAQIAWREGLQQYVDWFRRGAV